MNLQQTAFAIYELMKSFSILKITNCMTRLRLQLNTEDIANLPLKELKNIPNVLGVNLNDNELQIILGPGKVNEVTSEFKKLYANKNLETNAQNTNQDTNNNQQQFGNAEELHQQIRKKNASGLITGLLNIAFKIDPTLTNYPAIQVLQIAGNAVFFGLNIFVGINTAKEFHASPMLGGTMAAIITHPMLNNISLFNIDLLAGRGGIVAVLLVVAFSSWLENKLHKIVPKILDLFLTPLLVILIATFPALFILQPIGGIIAETIGVIVVSSSQRNGKENWQKIYL